MKHAEALLKDTENYAFVGDVIDQLHIGRTTFYRYFPPDCIKQLRNEMLITLKNKQILWDFWYLYADGTKEL
jgi:hypothetical protein